MRVIADVVMLFLSSAVITACGGGMDVPSPPPISITISPTSSYVPTGQDRIFTALVKNDNSAAGVTWSVSGSGCTGTTCGTLSAASKNSVTYTAPASLPAPASVTLMATSVADTTKSAAADVTVFLTGTITISVSPASPTVETHGTIDLTATVGNDPTNSGVKWRYDEPSDYCDLFPCGSINPTSTASGVPTTYSAPSVLLGFGPSITITAASVADPTVSATVPLQITCATSTDCVP